MAEKNEKNGTKKDSFAVSPGKIELKGKPRGVTVFSKKFKILVGCFIGVCFVIVVGATVANWKSAPTAQESEAHQAADKKPAPGQKQAKVTTVNFDNLYMGSQADTTSKPPVPPVGVTPQPDPAGMGPTTPVPGTTTAAATAGTTGKPGTVPAIPGTGPAVAGNSAPVDDPFGSSGPTATGKAHGDSAASGGSTRSAADTAKERAKTAGPAATGWGAGGDMPGGDPTAGMKESQGKLADALNGLKQAAANAGQGQGIMPAQETQDDPNKQARKDAFLKAASKVSDSDTLMQVVKPPLSPYMLTAGMRIPAALGCAVNTDLPGQICAQVTQNVYDKMTGKYLLIPQFTEIIGTYDSHIAIGQERILVAWSRLQFEDGSHLNLEGMPGADASGAAGFDADVNNHYGRTLATLAAASVFSAGLQISQGKQQSTNGTQTPQQQVAAAIGQNIAQTGAQITQRQLQIQPTLSRERGYKFVVQVTKDIIFPGPYSLRTR